MSAASSSAGAKVGGVVRQLLKPQVLQQLNEHLGVNTVEELSSIGVLQ